MSMAMSSLVQRAIPSSTGQMVEQWNSGADTLKWDEAKQRWLSALTDDTGVTWIKFMQDLYFVHHVTQNPSGLDSTQKTDYLEPESGCVRAGPAIGSARQPGATVNPDTLVVTDPQGFDSIFFQNPTNKGVKHTTWGGPSLDVNIVPFRTGDESTIQPTLDFGYWLVDQ